MNAVDASDHFDRPSQEQSPALLTVIVDTNPAAWSLLSSTLSLSSAIANLLVFINAHLAGNYTNKVAVIASHCDKATWLYPSPSPQKLPRSASGHSNRPSRDHHGTSQSQDLLDSTRSLKLDGPASSPSLKLNLKPPPLSSSTASKGNKYRPFRLVEEELLQNLTRLLQTTSPDALSHSTSTMIAGALTLALSHINRESISYTESLIGSSNLPSNSGGDVAGSSGGGEGATQALQSRILLISASPSTDLAHQYIPIMNAIFACQRLGIPIDILQLPLPGSSAKAGPHPVDPGSPSPPSADPGVGQHSDSTVFLQQAADATNGIFIPARLSLSSRASAAPTGASPTTVASQAFLTYLLTSLLPTPATRAAHLILPTRIAVDFRAACFCHRNVVSIGFVCSICLSIFCTPPDNGDCLTCGTHLSLGKYGSRPVVVRAAKKAKRKPVAR